MRIGSSVFSIDHGTTETSGLIFSKRTGLLFGSPSKIPPRPPQGGSGPSPGHLGREHELRREVRNRLPPSARDPCGGRGSRRWVSAHGTQGPELGSFHRHGWDSQTPQKAPGGQPIRCPGGRVRSQAAATPPCRRAGPIPCPPPPPRPDRSPEGDRVLARQVQPGLGKAWQGVPNRPETGIQEEIGEAQLRTLPPDACEARSQGGLLVCLLHHGRRGRRPLAVSPAGGTASSVKSVSESLSAPIGGPLRGLARSQVTACGCYNRRVAEYLVRIPSHGKIHSHHRRNRLCWAGCCSRPAQAGAFGKTPPAAFAVHSRHSLSGSGGGGRLIERRPFLTRLPGRH